MVAFNRILIPTDFSPDSQRAATYAEELAVKFGSELILLHVEQPVTPAVIGTDPGGVGLNPMAAETFAKISEEQRAISQRELDRMAEKLRARGINSRAIIKTGAPFMEIISACKAENIDLVVMGTHGRTGLSHILMGSVAERVVRKAPCAVLTVRDPDRKFQHPGDA